VICEVVEATDDEAAAPAPALLFSGVFPPFPKSLPNGEEGDPRLESEAKFLINCKGDEENGELLWTGV